MIDPSRSLARDRVTNVVGAAYVLIGASTAAMGPVGDELRRSWHLTRAVTGLHGALFGWFLLASALLSTRLVRAADAAVLLRVAVAALGAGLVVLASGNRVGITLLGAALAGLGGALIVLVSPQIVSAHISDDIGRAGAYTFINGLSQVGSIVAPLVLAFALRHQWGWRWPLAAIGAAGGALVGLVALRTDLPHHASSGETRAGAVRHLRTNRRARRHWATLTLGIAIEFGTLFWGAAAVRELGAGSSSAGAVGVGLFAGGMAVGRIAGHRLVARVPRVTLLRASFIVAGAATLLLRLGPGLATRVGALALAGIGLALVYPVAFARLYGTGVPDADVGAVGALGSGTAITCGPLALGAVADASSLRWALLLLPAMAVAGLLSLAGRAEPDMS